MNKNANTAFNLPHSKSSGTKINSIIFIVVTTWICVIAFSLDLYPETIQKAIITSANPMSIINVDECFSPRICVTISSCRGTIPSTLQNKPLINQAAAIR